MSSKFITVSVEILHDSNLSPNEKFILAEIEQLCSLEHGCYASNQHFSDLIGIARENASRVISKLASKGYIETEIKKGTRNRERVIKLTLGSVKTSIPCYQNVNTVVSKRQEAKENRHINIHTNKQGEEFPESIQHWIDYRKEIKKPIKSTTIKSLLKDYARDPDLFSKKVDHSISNGYQGLFPPKQQNAFKGKEPEVGSIGYRIAQHHLQRNNICDTIDAQLIEE